MDGVCWEQTTKCPLPKDIRSMDDRSYGELRKLKEKRALELGNTRKIKTQLGRTSTAVEKHLAIYSAAEETMKQTGKIPVDALNDVLLDGDIILFQGNNVGSCLQRCILNAPYDHVALVVKSPGNPFRKRKPSTYVLEANGRDGVAKYDLDVWIYMRTTMHAAFSKVVFRRLLCERTRKRRRALLKFVDRTIGHSYETNYANFVKAFFAVNSEESDLSTAFCSKLVAAALQDIGVMSKERNADIFLPGDFSEKRHGWCGCLASSGKLDKYMLDAKYGKEIEIDFTSSVYNFITQDKVLDKITEHDMALEICQNIEALTMIRRWAMANIKERRRRAEEAARDRAIGIGNGKTADEQSKPVNKASKNVEAGCSLENVDIDIATKVS